MKTEEEFHSNSFDYNGYKLSRKLKAVIGYWTDYFSGKYEDKVLFSIFGEKVAVKDRDNTHYTVYYKWLQFDVYYIEIFETLDLIESLLKGLHNDVEES